MLRKCRSKNLCNLLPKNRKVLLDNLPDGTTINLEVCVDQNVAHSNNSRPRNLRMLSSQMR